MPAKALQRSGYGDHPDVNPAALARGPPQAEQRLPPGRQYPRQARRAPRLRPRRRAPAHRPRRRLGIPPPERRKPSPSATTSSSARAASTPHTPKGLGLIAHELTHVGQQTGTTGSKARFFSEAGGDQMEREAQQTAEHVLANAGSRSGLFVEDYVREYEGEDRLTQADQQRLDRISVMALTEAQRMLASQGVRGSVNADALDVQVEIDLGEMSDGEAARVWASAIATALALQGRGSLSSETAAVQRYQAGESGHGGIEAEALHRAGFSGDMEHGDIGAIYFGNWLRDFSQLNKNAPVRAIINILALGEFNRTATAEELGFYMPSEHLDNPLVGGTAEDRLATGQERAANVAHLSAQQQAFLADPSLAATVALASRRSNLPEYIERGKEHSKRLLRDAIGRGQTPEGMMAMGNALHAIEDYFSHSNFVEVAMDLLRQSGPEAERGRSAALLQNAQRELHYDAASAGGRDAAGRARIITGTYEDSNSTVSLLETLKTEVMHGSLRNAFLRGYERLIGRGGAALGGGAAHKSGLSVAGGALVGLGGSIVEGVEGLAHGFQEGHGLLGTVGSTLAGGARGIASGAASGYHLGHDATENAARAVGDAAGQGTAIASEALIASVAGPLFLAAEASLHVLARPGGQFDQRAQRATAATPGAAKVAVAKHGGSVADEQEAAQTHSLLAKDAPDHPLFAVSRALAVEADVAIGEAMRRAWAGQATSEDVTRLVDVYVSYPTTSDWWREPLSQAMNRESVPTISGTPSPAATAMQSSPVQRQARAGTPADQGRRGGGSQIC